MWYETWKTYETHWVLTYSWHRNVQYTCTKLCIVIVPSILIYKMFFIIASWRTNSGNSYFVQHAIFLSIWHVVRIRNDLSSYDVKTFQFLDDIICEFAPLKILKSWKISRMTRIGNCSRVKQSAGSAKRFLDIHVASTKEKSFVRKHMTTNPFKLCLKSNCSRTYSHLIKCTDLLRFTTQKKPDGRINNKSVIEKTRKRQANVSTRTLKDPYNPCRAL